MALRNCQKGVCGHGYTPDAAGRANDAPTDPYSVGDGGYPFPFPFRTPRCLRHLVLGAFGASFSEPLLIFFCLYLTALDRNTHHLSGGA